VDWTGPYNAANFSVSIKSIWLLNKYWDPWCYNPNRIFRSRLIIIFLELRFRTKLLCIIYSNLLPKQNNLLWNNFRCVMILLLLILLILLLIRRCISLWALVRSTIAFQESLSNTLCFQFSILIVCRPFRQLISFIPFDMPWSSLKYLSGYPFVSIFSKFYFYVERGADLTHNL
jgi:hypothetical protein